MHSKQGGDLGDREPSLLTKMMGKALDPIGLPDIANVNPGERLPGSGAQAPGIEGIGGLLIGLFRGQHTDHLDDRRGSTSEIRCGERQGTFQAGRGSTLPTDVDPDRLRAEQSDIIDE